MSRTARLDDLRDEVKVRADMRGTSFISDADLNRVINQSWAHFREWVTLEAGHDFYLTTGTISISSGTELYSLPSDFGRLKHVSVQVSGNDSTPAHPYELQEIDRYDVPGVSATATLYYLPVQTDLSADSDTVEGWNGWEHWIVLDAAIFLLDKEESDSGPLRMERERIEKTVRAAASMRDGGRARRVIDVSRRFGGYGLNYIPQDFWYRLRGGQISFRTARDYTVAAT